jgi:hypothetical protein
MAGSFFGLPAKAPFRSTRCRRRAPLQPMQGHFGGVFGEDGGEVHIALLEANAVTVFQVDGGDQQHGRCR